MWYNPGALGPCGVKTSCPSESDEVGGKTYQPTYQPTYKPSLRGSDDSDCADDEAWRYYAGEKGSRGCDHVASESDKVEKRCSQRVSEDGVPAYYACRKTCGNCDCADNDDWRYDAGDKGSKGCDHVASEEDLIDKRCSKRVSDDGVLAKYACSQTCGTC